ncbi:hypothetical protein [Amycolatopsis plumensis]|uniref:Uncharacterized protein n=1 Tax=Amycolatopsis plumensis TaxID=236508 RepID=A0ABV5UEG3_9PSEU
MTQRQPSTVGAAGSLDSDGGRPRKLLRIDPRRHGPEIDLCGLGPDATTRGAATLPLEHFLNG